MPLPLHSYSLGEPSTSRLLNAFPLPLPQGASAPFALRRVPGISKFVACGSGPGRGLHVMNGTLYALSGHVLFRIGSSPSYVRIIGGQIDGSDIAHMDNNGNELVISASMAGYVFNGSQVSQILDSDFLQRPPGSVRFVDQYMSWIERKSGRWFISDLAQATVYDALDFASAEGAPDNLVSHIVDHRQVVLFGKDSSEIWENVGGADFPFVRTVNGFIEQGCAAEYSLVKQDHTVYWLGNDLTVRRLEGNSAAIASNDGMHRAITKYSSVTDCIAFSFTIEGRPCVCFSFPSAKACWVLDIRTNEWHEREGFGGSEWDVSGIARCYGKIFIQRRSTGEIGILDPNVCSEWGMPLVSSWTYQPLRAPTGKIISISRLEMALETGVSGTDTEAFVLLEGSSQGGRAGTFEGFGSRSLGTGGKFNEAISWDALGGYENMTFRASMSSDAPLTIWGTEVSTK